MSLGIVCPRRRLFECSTEQFGSQLKCPLHKHAMIMWVCVHEVNDAIPFF